jgi:Ni,Fe-hydrogenase III large subunit
MKKPLVYELSEAIDGMASIGEANLLRISRGVIRPLPGGNGPVNERRMEELRAMLDVMQSALSSDGDEDGSGARADRLESMMEFLRELVVYISDDKRRVEFAPVLEEVADVFQQVAVRVLEIRGSRAVRNILQLTPAMSSSSAE